jgi:hypothetical protein
MLQGAIFLATCNAILLLKDVNWWKLWRIFDMFRKHQLGRILWPIIVQFRCPHSGSTFSLHQSIDFDTLSTNSLVVTRTDPQFFCILRSNINIFY